MVVTGCGGYYSTKSGVIMSLNYPLGYAHASQCFWLIELPLRNTIKLTFQDFDVEAGRADSCNYDYVAVCYTFIMTSNLDN